MTAIVREASRRQSDALRVQGVPEPGQVPAWEYSPTTGRWGPVWKDPPEPTGSGAEYQHAQPTASATWTINHNLGYRPAVHAYSDGSREMLAEIQHVSLNQTIIYFDGPVSGFATCS